MVYMEERFAWGLDVGSRPLSQSSGNLHCRKRLHHVDDKLMQFNVPVLANEAILYPPGVVTQPPISPTASKLKPGTPTLSKASPQVEKPRKKWISGIRSTSLGVNMIRMIFGICIGGPQIMEMKKSPRSRKESRSSPDSSLAARWVPPSGSVLWGT